MSNSRSSGRPAALALIGICILFIAILGRGWQGLFLPYGLSISVFVGLLIALIAIALAYAIADERVHYPHTRVTTATAAYFFVLFNISALGTINAMFVTFQAGNILREEIDRGSSAVIKLKDVGLTSLAPQLAEYEKFVRKVDDNLKALTDEIENPNICGQGPVATRHAQALQVLLPNFRILSGGGCQKAKETSDSYKARIPELVKNSAQHAAVKEPLALRDRVNGESKEMLARFTSAHKMLGFGGSIQAVKAQLFETAEQYSRMRMEFGAKLSSVAVPEKIDTSAVSALGAIGQVLPFLLSRLSDHSTYIYLIIALVLDLTVIAAFARVLRSGLDPRQRRTVSSPRQL